MGGAVVSAVGAKGVLRGGDGARRRGGRLLDRRRGLRRRPRIGAGSSTSASSVPGPAKGSLATDASCAGRSSAAAGSTRGDRARTSRRTTSSRTRRATSSASQICTTRRGAADGPIPAWSGRWDLMGDNRASAHLSAWNKWLLRWLDPTQLRGLTTQGAPSGADAARTKRRAQSGHGARLALERVRDREPRASGGLRAL